MTSREQKIREQYARRSRLIWSVDDIGFLLDVINRLRQSESKKGEAIKKVASMFRETLQKINNMETKK